MKHRPATVFLENVMKVEKLLLVLGRIFRKAGYIMGWIREDPSAFGVPNTRPRIYIYLLRRVAMHPDYASLSIDDCEAKFQDNCKAAAITLLDGSKYEYTFDMFLLARDDPYFVAIYPDNEELEDSVADACPVKCIVTSARN